MVRVVIDTNVFIGMLLKSKNCLKIRGIFLDGGFDIVISPNLAGNADFIVTGDKDLLVLKSLRKIPIIKPRQFLKILNP